MIAERIRFAEIIAVHVDAGWINEAAESRLINLACNPGAWDEFKDRGGDNILDDDEFDDEPSGDQD